MEIKRGVLGNEVDVIKSGSIADHDSSEYLDLEQPLPGTRRTQSFAHFDVKKIHLCQMLLTRVILKNLMIKRMMGIKTDPVNLRTLLERRRQ